ncbi:MAG: hypothetical protein J7623_00925 [Chitinophaga sp.]|uniref:tetratricopeptide repeat protein n=1 Tax=Chitinophaga sp. TaxID=1869181 RepID=UPI001B1958EE|nr:hypothetical protein [Chitinophaga sp.]MBO9727178.1 hypothetical protein [Chitinophaga sp.]
MRLIPLFAFGVLLASCHTGNKADQSAKLSLSSIYNADSVKWVAANTPEKNNAAEKEFLKGIDIYRNKKNPKGSIDQFVKSILLQPQGKSYYELGNALLDLRKTTDAIQAYNMAEALDYKPLSKLLYNKACAYSLSEKVDSARYCLLAAIEFGYSNMKNIMSDPDLSYFRDNYNFKSEVIAAFSGAGDTDKLEWNLFSSQFKQLPLPLTIDTAYVRQLGKNFIPYDFEMYVAEMRDSKFSRDVGSNFYYVGLVKKAEAFKTLIYAVSDDVYDSDEVVAAPAYYFMVSYDNGGKLIDKMLVSGNRLIEDPYRLLKIAGNSEFEVTEYHIEYEKNPAENGFVNNPEKSRTETKRTNFTITDDGHFTPKTQQLALNR